MKIAIIDDHPLVRKGLMTVLSLELTNELVGEAENISGALEVIHREKPDVAIVDLRLKGEYGLDIVKKAKEQGAACKFMVLTSSSNIDDFRRAKELDVEGYMLKDALPEELSYAVRIVGRGRKYYYPGLMEMVVNNPDDEIDMLTSREREVLAALGHGLKNTEIAKKLYISECTVKKHISQIFDKLSFDDRTQAAIYANSKGLVKR